LRRKKVKALDGMTVMLGFLALGLGVMAGGPVWVSTGSLLLGGVTGVVVVVFLGCFCRVLGRRRRNFRVLGEVGEELVEEDFTLVGDQDMPRERVQQEVRRRPERVADSIRSMLTEKEKRRKG